MYVDSFNAPFPAKLTGKTSSGGTWKYAWSEQRVVPTSGALETATEGRSGTTSIGYAVEMNNSEVATDTYVWMRVRASITGDLVYDFMAPDGTLAGGDSIAVIEEVDGSPSYTAISTLRFDSADGFVVTQPGTGIARVDIAAATASQAGVVSTAAQTLGGRKSFTNNVDSGPSVSSTFGAAIGQYYLSNTAGVGDVAGVLQVGDDPHLGYEVVNIRHIGNGALFGNQSDLLLRPNGELILRYSNSLYSSFGTPAYCVVDSSGVKQAGGSTTTGGLTFAGGLYISGTATTYTDEAAQDAVGAMVADTDTINVTYTDATPELKWDVRYQMSITSDASGIKLSGDSASPGNSYFYGTNGSGTKGWYATSTISGTLDINGLTADDIAVADAIPFYDDSGADNNKITVKRLAGYVNPGICEFRISTQSGTAISRTDQSSKGTIYMVPMKDIGSSSVSGSGRLALWDGTRWNLHLTAEISLALTVSSGSNYDVFAYDNSGTITLELSSAWSSDTARTTNLDLRDGVKVKSGDHTRRYLASIRGSGANVIEDSKTKRFLWNENHRVPKTLLVTESTNSWTYGSASWRSANNSTANRVEFLIGMPNEMVEAKVLCFGDVGAGVDGCVGIGYDATTANSAQLRSEATNADAPTQAWYRDYPELGYHYLQWIEYARTGTPSFLGDAGTVTFQSGMEGVVWC